MIPLKDCNPTRRFAVITISMIVLNVAVFIKDRLSGHYERYLTHTNQGVVAVTHFVGGLSERLSLIPAELVSHPFIEWPTIFTSMFLHGNWLHIAFNMLYLWIFGNTIEATLGRAHFLLFYFTCGIAAALAQVLSDPTSTVPMIGASGAIAGTSAHTLILFPRARILTLIPIFIIFFTVEIPALLIIGYWALIQVVSAYWLGRRRTGRRRSSIFCPCGGIFDRGFTHFAPESIATRRRCAFN